MPQLEALIFDLDGVITDTAHFHFIAWRKIANDLGFDLSEADNEKIKGLSRMDSLIRVLEIGGISFEEAKLVELATAKNEHYQTFIREMTPEDILPGMADFLEQGKAAGLKLAVGSSSKNAPIILEQLELDTFFDTVVDGNGVTHSKPDPEVFVKAAAQIGVNPTAAIVFEDAMSGVEAAKAGGFCCVGVGDPAHLHKANHVIPNTVDLSLDALKEQLNFL